MNPEKNVTLQDINNLRKTQSYQSPVIEPMTLKEKEQFIHDQKEQEESDQETLNKRIEEADGREQDLADGWEPEL